MKRTTLTLLFGCLALGACSGNQNSFEYFDRVAFRRRKATRGGGGHRSDWAAAAPPVSTPTDRAFQVGSVTARAAKCGYNFDPAKIKANYMAYETSMGLAPADSGKIEKIYTVAYNGITKAAGRRIPTTATRRRRKRSKRISTSSSLATIRRRKERSQPRSRTRAYLAACSAVTPAAIVSGVKTTCQRTTAKTDSETRRAA